MAPLKSSAWLSVVGILLLSACSTTPSLGEARSLWRHGEPEALAIARAVARSSDAGKAQEALRLACEIGLSQGALDEVRADYNRLRRLSKAADWVVLEPLCELTIQEALRSPDFDRRCRAARSLRLRARRSWQRALCDDIASRSEAELLRVATEARRSANEAYDDLLCAALRHEDESLRLEACKIAGLTLTNLPAAKAESIRHALVEVIRRRGSERDSEAAILALIQSRSELPADCSVTTASLPTRLCVAWIQERRGERVSWAGLIERLEQASAAEREALLRQAGEDAELAQALACLEGKAPQVILRAESLTLGDRDPMLLRGVFALLAERGPPLRLVERELLERYRRRRESELAAAALFTLSRCDSKALRGLVSEQEQGPGAPALRAMAVQVWDELEQPSESDLIRAAEGHPDLANVIISRLPGRGSLGRAALLELAGKSDRRLHRPAIQALVGSLSLDEDEAAALFERMSEAQRVCLIQALARFRRSKLSPMLTEAVLYARAEIDIEAAAILLDAHAGWQAMRLSPGP